MNSCDRMSATSARTVRAMMPMGITLIVMAGSTRCCMCSQVQRHSPEPPGPAPPGGSQGSSTENTITITMPSQ